MEPPDVSRITLIARLHLVVPFNSIVICRRRILSAWNMLFTARARTRSTVFTRSRRIAHNATLLLSLWLLTSRRTVVHLPLLTWPPLVMRDIIVCDPFASALIVDRLIVVVVLRVAGDYVPLPRRQPQMLRLWKLHVGTDQA